jgi:hypothetical protein
LDGERITKTSFYETASGTSGTERAPGCPKIADCGYYWYLDATETGVALVVCPSMAADIRTYLSDLELSWCVVE